MPVIIDRVARSKPGEPCLLGSTAADGEAAVVLENDGESAYFYACKSVGGPILDALCFFTVASVVQRDRPSEYGIGWSRSSRQAVLLIDGHPHAVFRLRPPEGLVSHGIPAAVRGVVRRRPRVER